MTTTYITTRRTFGGSTPSNPLDYAGQLFSTTGDLAGSTAQGALGTIKYISSVGKTFSGNNPSKSDYNTTVLTIVLVGLLLALLLTGGGTIVKVAGALR